MSKSMRKGSKMLAFFVALIMTAFVCIDASFFAIKANAQTVISAQSIVEDMGIGWNLGNSLDAHGAGSVENHETHWGNPVVTENLIKAVKAKGFNTVRVPVTWYEHITYNNGQYTIDPAWFARVKEVVDYAYNNGMYVILNVHHENWVNRSDLADSYDSISAELKKVWRQIASYFKDYDQHLIFEGMNEPRMEGAEGEWTGNAACYNVINKLNADFISTVRSVDSPYKTTRLLMVPGYAASADYGIYSSLDKNLFKDDYVAASVHAYKPYEFAMGDGDHSAFSSEYKSQLDSIFGDLRSFFTQDDIPVVIGEFSASNYGYTSARVEWAEYYMTLAKEIGAACVLWDNNVEANNGGEAHGYINRSNNTWYSASEAVVNKLISVRNDSSIVWGSKSSYPLYSHEDYNSGTEVSAASDTVMKVTEMSGFTSGKELAIKYNSDTTPIIAIANSSWGGWTEFSPYDYTNTDSYKIAYVRYDDIYGAWDNANGELYHIKVKNYDSISFSGIKMLDIKTSDGENSNNPIKLDIAKNRLSLGYYHSGYITTNNNLYTWGDNTGGMLGNGTEIDNITPQKIMSNVVQVSMGSSSSACITENGDLYTWGSNSYGQLGDGTTSNKFNPKKIMSNVVQVSMGSSSSACITENGDLYTWGSNSYGQLGDGTTSNKSSPQKIMSNVVQVSMGSHHSACITANGDLYLWGYNNKGQLGDGTQTDRHSPVKIMSGISQVSIRGYNSACITEKGDLYTWGNNSMGNLGNNTTINGLIPEKIMSDVSQVSLGGDHSACVTENGDLYTWGGNNDGQLGNDSIKEVKTPIKIMSNVLQVELGGYLSACITESNELYSWGENYCGQLGDGTTTDRHTPVKISIPENQEHFHVIDKSYSSDATGHWHTCSGCSEKVSFSAHTEDSGTVTKQPTETTEGEKTFKCTVCNYVIRTEPISKLGHTHTPAQTWTSDSTGHWHTCSGCSEKVSFAAHTEDSGTVTKQPTETTEGEKTFKCTVCNYVIRTEPISKLGHTHTPAQTWTSDSTGHWHTCSGCSEKVSFATHTEDSGTVTKQPTETTDGEKTFKCTVCNYVIRTEPISKLGHTHTPAQTWTSDITGHWHTCSGCSEKIDFADHIDDMGTITKQPTETEEGEKEYRCKICKYLLITEVIPPKSASPVTVSDGTETKTFDDLTTALKAYKTTTKSLTVTLNTNANVKTLFLPTKASSIAFEGEGALNINGTSISIPANTTFNVALNGTNTRPLAVKVSAGKTLTINSETSNIGAVSGTKTSILNLNENAEAVSLATFGEVNVAEEKTLTVTSKVSAITKLNGTVKLPTAKTTAATVTAGKAEIILTNGNIAKVTIADVTDKLNVKVVNENGETVALASGTVVLYSTKDISEKVTVENKTSDEKELNAFYYKKNKAIKAEWADAVTLSYGDTHRMFPNVELALEGIKDKNTDYTLTLNTNVTEPKFALPKTAKSITINGTGTLTTAVTSIAAPVDTTIGCAIKQSADKPIALKAAANTKLTLAAENTFGAVSGTKTSILNVNENTEAVSLATFGEVNVAETKTLTVTSKVSAITKLNGAVKLPTAKTTAATVTAGKAEIILTNGNIAKVTIADVTEALNVKVVNENGETVDLASGTVVLYGTKDISEKVTVENKTSDEKELNAFYYKKKKEIKAEWADAVTLSYGETNRKFPNTELALESMTDKYTDYTVTLNTDISASTFALPASAQSITIKSMGEEQKTITLTNITTVSAKTPLTLENVAIESTKPFAISTSSDLTLNNFTSTSITAVKGGSKAALTLGKTSPIDKVSGFGTTKVTDEFKTGTTFTTTSLELAETANLVVSNTKTAASAKALKGTEGSCIKLEEGFTPIKVTGTTADSISGTIKLKSENEITDSTVLFTTKYAGNNVFDVSEIAPQETEIDYTVTSISGKAYMKPIVFEMSGKGYALWTDVVTMIENVKASEAEYTVKLLDDTNINGALKLPKAGTYKKLTITSENKTLAFTGSVTATGELEVVSTNLNAVKNNASAKYTLTAGRYPFSAENAVLNLASISGTADVTLKNVTTNGNVKAGKLTLNGTNTVLGTVTAAELGSTEVGTVLNVLYNAKGVMKVTPNGITNGSEEISIKLVDANGTAVTAENKNILASTFKGSYDGQLKLSTDNGTFSIVLVKGKLVLADSVTIANSAFDDIVDSADEEEAEEPNDEETSGEETTDEDTSEEETTDDDEASDEDTSDEAAEDESDDTSNETEDTENDEETDETSGDYDDENITDELSA